MLGYDRLVIALGAQLAPDTVPGFTEGAHGFCRLDGATAGRDALHTLTRRPGRPSWCPGPRTNVRPPLGGRPAHRALLRRRGIRGRCTVDVYFPEPLPMSTAGPRIGHAVVDLLTQRGIGFHPAHQAPTVIRDSTLANPTGFIPVGPATLATSVQGVYAIGDVTAVPISAGKSLPKAGVFAHAQADVVARRIGAARADVAGDAIEYPAARSNPDAYAPCPWFCIRPPSMKYVDPVT